MKSTYIATVQVVLRPGAASSESDACDWFSASLTDNHEVLDWQYLQVNGQGLSPTEKVVDDPAQYEEGSAFRG